jgi:hypothetical protein
MKFLTVALCCLLASCANMTPKQKKYTAIGIYLVGAGIALSHDGSSRTAHPDVSTPPNPCQQSPSSCQ